MNYARLSLKERETIFELRVRGESQRSIARTMNRHQSTISRELNRLAPDYRPSIADCQARQLAASRREGKVKMKGLLTLLVNYRLRRFCWSPEQISADLKKRYPHLPERHVSHETIYQFIYEHPDPWHRREMIKALRRRKKKRGRPPLSYRSRGQIRDMVSISERPEVVNQREELGHWEGDLIIGKQGASALGTLVERASRYTLLVPLTGRDSTTVTEAFAQALTRIPSEVKKSLTYDQGKEMSLHKQFSQATGMAVYFANAGCPWQRGTNENTNGLLRQFLPKKSDLSHYSSEEISQIEHLINHRPRKTLSFQSPAERLTELLS